MKDFPPFYVGQKVVAVDATPTSMFKNGTEYIVSAIDYHLGNPHHPIGRVTYYWYVGIAGFGDDKAYYKPSIFQAIEEKFESISLEKVLENETSLISSN